MQRITKSKSKNLRLIRKSVVNKRETDNQSFAETTGSAMTGVTSEERHQLIATAAYFRAERRNFIPGLELDDWLEAEAEIKVNLANVRMNGQPNNA